MNSILIACASGLAAGVLGLGSAQSASQNIPVLPSVPAAALNATPRGFVPNVGQLASDAVKFSLRNGGVTAYFTDQGFVLWNGRATTLMRDGIEVQVPVMPRWELVGAKRVTPAGGDLLSHTISFFRGSDPAGWNANVPAYGRLTYPEILNGVELRVENRERGFEYLFQVNPRAKPDLRFRYHGITALETSPTGDLIVRTSQGYFVESHPVSYQMIAGVKFAVDSRFEVTSTNEYRIVVGPYDERHELIVDPVLDWSTFLGGSYSVNLRDVAVDSAGNICVSGTTTAPDLPDTAGWSTGPGTNYLDGWIQDVVVAKFNPSGTDLLWLGYLAGAGPTTEEVGFGNSLALDSAGNLLIVGFTESADFPVTAGSPHAGAADIFVTKLSHDGSAILSSSLLGGSNSDYASGITRDALENIFVTGWTASANFPVTVGALDTTLGGGQDALVVKYDPLGTFQWATFLGGANGDERGAALVVDASGDLLVAGDTGAADFPVTPGAWDTNLGGTNDAFLARIRPDGSAILWATFIGGSGAENDLVTPFSPTIHHRADLALDSLGNIVIAGQTLSADFPVTTGAFQTALAGDMDGYVAKLTPDGASLLWATYLGGSGGNEYQELIWGIALNPWDEVLLIGRTDSPNFPVTPDALLSSYPGGLQDGFLTKLKPDGSSVLYSTFLGGSQARDVALGLRYDSGNVFVCGWAASTSYPITAGAFQTACSSCPVGWADGVVLKFLDAFVAHDGFETGNYSGGSGWVGSWAPSGDASIVTSSGPHAGLRQARLRRGTGALTRAVNVPPVSTALKLGFWSKLHSFEEPDHAQVRISANGVSITNTLTAAQADNIYHYHELDLANFLSAAQIQITFDANMGDVNDNWYLDDIRITGTTGALPPLANAGPDQILTDIDNSGAEVVTLNGTASFDPDGGSILSYEWKDGTTVLGTGAILQTSLHSSSVHTITLTVTDNEGTTASDTIQVTINNAPSQPTQSHVGDLSGNGSNQGSTKWKATVVVTVHNNAVPSHQLVPGATVTGTWSGGFNGTATATTGANGQCTFATGQMPKAGTSTVTFTINNVQHPALTYNAAANHGANGASITVPKPN